LKITNCTFTAFDSTNWTSAIEIAKDMTGVLIQNCLIFGEFSDSGIEIPSGGNAQVNFVIDNCQITNATTGQHAIQVSGTASTGVISNCSLVTDGTYVDAGGLQIVKTVFAPYGTDSDTSVDSGASTDLATINLDHLMKTTTGVVADADLSGIVVDATLLSHIMTAGADTSDYKASTDSLEAIGTGAASILVDTTAIVADTEAQDTHAEMMVLTDPNFVSYDAPRIVTYTTAAMSSGYGTAESPLDLFTVTGTIKARVVAVVGTSVTSTSNTGTLSLGVVGDVGCLLAVQTIDATAFVANDVWTLDQDADTPSAESPSLWTVIPNGLSIDLTIATNNMTAGVVTFYIEWIPLSSDAALAATL